MWVFYDSRIAESHWRFREIPSFSLLQKSFTGDVNVDSLGLHLKSLGIHRRTMDSGQKLDVVHSRGI
ncbi:hypothetical protein F2Q68_00010128 [Brassica cretica]|uniref:Uncharacterized protein n=1 Tax=Brassica cretica TaxID=69181 RepID=A0A8S9KZC4_BRACR|nr:hypothetical protein F2Q68_00010128 [Brassica cretica]